MQGLGGSDKDANVACGIERDIGGVASAPPPVFSTIMAGSSGGLRCTHPRPMPLGTPAPADALRPAEFRGRDVGRGCGRILVHGDSGQTEKVLEPTRHVVRCRVHTTRPGSGRRIGTPALIPGADEEASTLAGSGAQRRIPQPKRFCDSVGEELRVGLAGRSGQRVREQVEPDVGIVGGGSGKKAQTIAREPFPAKVIVGKREVAAIARGIGDFAGEASSVRGQIAQCDRAAAGHSPCGQGR